MKTTLRRRPIGSRGDSIIANARRGLRETGELSLRAVRLAFVDEALVLTGRVPTRYERRLAEEIVTAIPGVEYVDNCIEVDHRVLSSADDDL